jgi:hypothetical protein
MSWQVVEIMFTLIHNMGGRLYDKLHLVMMLADCIHAMLGEKADVRNKVEHSRECLRELRKGYYPRLDTDLYTSENRTEYELLLDDLMRDLFVVIYENNLISPSILGQVYGDHWK